MALRARRQAATPGSSCSTGTSTATSTGTAPATASETSARATPASSRSRRKPLTNREIMNSVQGAIATEATKLALSNAGVSMSMSDVNMSNVGKNNDTAADMKDGEMRMDIWTMGSYGLAAAGAVCALLAMIFVQEAVVIVAMIICLLDCGVVAVQRTSLSKMETLRQVHNKLREEVNRLQVQNSVLHQTNDELRSQVDRLGEVEQGLQDVVTQQGESIDKFVQTVKENQAVLDEIKENLEARVLQDLVNIVISSDDDKDFKIDPEEIDSLVGRMSMVSGVELNEANFRKVLAKSGYSLTAVLDICRTIVDGDNTNEDDKVMKVNLESVRPGDI